MTGQAQPVKIRPALLADLPDVLRVRQAQELADSGTSVTTANQLSVEWEALGPRLAGQVWVAETADGGLIACGDVVRVDQVLMLRLWVLPEHRGIRLESILLAVAEQSAYEMSREEGAHTQRLFAQATGSHPEVRQALLQSDFFAVSTYEQMELVLDRVPENPSAIAGISIRPIVGGQDEQAVVYRADEEAFLDERGYTPRTFDRWRRRLRQGKETGETSSVWLIAWDADEIAGAALGEIIQGVGWIHHLGVRRPWRRRGLGLALTLAALDSFYRQGIRTVRLNVDAESLTGAHQLYRRLGFLVCDTYSNFEKIVQIADK
jgi:mycothiol synthase